MHGSVFPGRGTQGPPAGTQNSFLGHAYDGITALLQDGARLYDPNLSRFLSPDPVGTPGNPQSLDSYGYSDENPATKSDPSGMIGDKECEDCATQPPTLTPPDITYTTYPSTAAGPDPNDPVEQAIWQNPILAEQRAQATFLDGLQVVERGYGALPFPQAAKWQTIVLAEVNIPGQPPRVIAGVSYSTKPQIIAQLQALGITVTRSNVDPKGKDDEIKALTHGEFALEKAVSDLQDENPGVVITTTRYVTSNPTCSFCVQAASSVINLNRGSGQQISYNAGDNGVWDDRVLDPESVGGLVSKFGTSQPGTPGNLSALIKGIQTSSIEELSPQTFAEPEFEPGS